MPFIVWILATTKNRNVVNLIQNFSFLNDFFQKKKKKKIWIFLKKKFTKG